MFSIFDFYVLVDEIYKKAPLTGHTRFGHPIGSLTWFNRSIETFLFNFFFVFFLFNFLNSIWSYLRDFIWIRTSHITLISINVRSYFYSVLRAFRMKKKSYRMRTQLIFILYPSPYFKIFRIINASFLFQSQPLTMSETPTWSSSCSRTTKQCYA